MERSNDGEPPKREPIFNHFPNAVAGLIAAILAAHLVQLWGGDQLRLAALSHYAVIPAQLVGEPSVMEPGAGMAQRLVPYISHQFIHGGLLHLMMNLALLLQVGPLTERAIAPGRDAVARFLIYFFLCGIAGALGYVWLNADSQVPMIGASGAISGIFGGYLWAALRFAPPGSPIKRAVLTSGVVFVAINVGLAAVASFSGFLPIAWESHLFGFLAGLVLWPLIATRRA